MGDDTHLSRLPQLRVDRRDDGVRALGSEPGTRTSQRQEEAPGVVGASFAFPSERRSDSTEGLVCR